MAKCSVPSLESLVIEMQQSKIGSAVFPSISSLSSQYHQPELYLKISIQKKKQVADMGILCLKEMYKINMEELLSSNYSCLYL